MKSYNNISRPVHDPHDPLPKIWGRNPQTPRIDAPAWADAITTSFRIFISSASSRNLLRGALSPAEAKEKCLKKSHAPAEPLRIRRMRVAAKRHTCRPTDS